MLTQTSLMWTRIDCYSYKRTPFLTVIFIKSKLLSIQCFLRSKLSLVIQQVFLFILNAVTFDENSLKPLIKTVSAYGWIFKFLLQNHLPKDKNTKFRASAYS